MDLALELAEQAAAAGEAPVGAVIVDNGKVLASSPNRMRELDYPRLELCRQAVIEIDGVEQYLASDRRLPFNEDGIFRHYPELDSE